MAAYPLDVDDDEHREFRAKAAKLAAEMRGVIDLRPAVDLTEQETRVDLGAA